MRLKARQQPRLRGGLSAHTGRGTPVCLTEDQTAQGKANAVGLGQTDSPESGALGLRARLTRFQEPLHRV